MKRVIKEFVMPIPGQVDLNGNPIVSASIFAIPPGTQGIQYNGKTYLDYITEGEVPSDALYVGEMKADGTIVDLIGSGIQDTFPHVFAGWDRKIPTPDKPIIILPAHIAKIMLLRAGYLDIVKSAVVSIGAEAQLAWDNAPDIHSDNALVVAVLTKIGLNDEQIYQLFLDASNIII